MRIIILGANGYIGWPLSLYLESKGHDILCVDNHIKNYWCRTLEIAPLQEDIMLRKKCEGTNLELINVDATKDFSVRALVNEFDPDAIVHLAEQPSAPFSMMDDVACLKTVTNNTATTINALWGIKDTNVHLIKLGTMGEYGTPDIDIEEGYIEIRHHGRKDTLPFPKLPGSFYHASKVADSAFIEFACRAWTVRATDLNQGVVYGISTPQTEEIGKYTNFYYDDVFGTAINRFIAQSVTTKEITVYGGGRQRRGFINLNDTLRCIELACLNPPPPDGTMRVMNQFTELYSLCDLAYKIGRLTGAKTKHVNNPRIESENHYYNPKNKKLLKLGLEPTLLSTWVLEQMINHVRKYKDNINVDKMLPKVNWR